MHIAVAWDIGAEEPAWSKTNEKLVKALDGYSWVRPLSTLYIVRVAGESERQAIQERLLAVAKGAGVKVNFLMSPAMSGGRYNGYLPADAWEKINKRTDP